MVSASAISTTTISLFWPSDTVVSSYEVMWETGDIGGCSGGSDMGNATVTASSTSYTIMGLEEDSSYTIIKFSRQWGRHHHCNDSGGR